MLQAKLFISLPHYALAMMDEMPKHFDCPLMTCCAQVVFTKMVSAIIGSSYHTDVCSTVHFSLIVY